VRDGGAQLLRLRGGPKESSSLVGHAGGDGFLMLETFARVAIRDSLWVAVWWGESRCHVVGLGS
jgi:hypothetical protein